MNTLFNPPPVGRTVLELGSGVGLTGVTICRSCSLNRFVFSDCHPSVLQKLRNNIQLNGLTDQTSPAVSVEEMDWTAATEEQLKRIGADTIIAAGQYLQMINSLVSVANRTIHSQFQGWTGF